MHEMVGENEKGKAPEPGPPRTGAAGPPGEPGREQPGQEPKAHKPTKHEVELEADELRYALELAEARSAEYLDSLQRMKAEFENYRKRMLREQTNHLETANAELVSKLLPVLDDLELVLQHAAETDHGEGLIEGLRMVYGKFVDMLMKQGLEEINPEGSPFDPQESEAMMAVPSNEHADCTVLQVLKKGYRWRGKLLRPAMVTVSQCTSD